MDTGLKQLLRWGMSGWCLILEVGAFYALANKFLTFGFRGWIPLTQVSAAVALAVAAGVPLGYFLYQIYYFLYWMFPFSKRQPNETAIVDKMVDKCKHFKNQPQFKELKSMQEGFINSVRYTARTAESDNQQLKWWIERLEFHKNGRKVSDVMKFRNTWSIARSVWLGTLAKGKANSGGIAAANDRFEYLTSVFDGLGAVMIANFISIFIAIYLAFSHLGISPSTAVYLVIVSTISYVFHIIIWTNRLQFRSSLITEMYAFICLFWCSEPDCFDKEMSSVS